MNNIKEFGGFLPIELHHGKDYFEDYPARKYNCANAALSELLSSLEIKTIYAPFYLCPNVCAQLESHNVVLSYYHLNNDLTPVVSEIADESGSVIYIVDYFGIMDSKISELAENVKNAYLIIDFCHSFFCKPIIRDNTYNLYSARKFFGVPDGAYLVCKDVGKISGGDKFFSSDYAAYILKSLEHGTNYCYAEKKQADKLIADNYGAMSELTERIMQGADYEFVMTRRRNNARLFDEAFGDINRLSVEPQSVPYAYPLNIGKNIKSQLINEKIYVPTLWSQLLDDKFKGTLEYDLTENTLFLPVDQRYDEEDIIYMINIIRKYIG